MGAKRLEDLRAWQFTRAFKIEVYRLVRQSPMARSDFRFRQQLMDAAASGEANLAEGFRRFGAGEFIRFLGFAIASIEEASRRVQDGIDREYFTQEACQSALTLGLTALKNAMALKTSLRAFVGQMPRVRKHSPTDRTSDELGTEQRRPRTEDPTTED